MLEIIKILMAFGMDFEFENYGSKGEKITACQIGLDVSNQDGKIYYSCFSEKETFKETPGQYKALANRVQEECISETT